MRAQVIHQNTPIVDFIANNIDAEFKHDEIDDIVTFKGGVFSDFCTRKNVHDTWVNRGKNIFLRSFTHVSRSNYFKVFKRHYDADLNQEFSIVGLFCELDDKFGTHHYFGKTKLLDEEIKNMDPDLYFDSYQETELPDTNEYEMTPSESFENNDDES